MPSLAEINTSLNNYKNTTSPLVVVLAGGTTGIGSYIAKALATTFKDAGHKLRVYIVGRNAERGHAVISESQHVCKGSEWRFIKVDDLAEMGDVDRACEEIMAMEKETPFAGGEPRIDLLYLTYSVSVIAKRATTSTGQDALMSTLYYTRIRFILNLLPLLTASPLGGHAISVYAGNMEHHSALPKPPPIGFPPDSTYSITTVRKHVSLMENFIFEDLARRHAGKLRLTHIYPGLVDGPGFYSAENPLWFRVLWRILKPVMRLFMVSAEDCGKVMVFLGTERFAARGMKADGEGVEVVRGTDGEVGSGAYACGRFGDVGESGVAYPGLRDGDVGERVWEHTMDVVGRDL